MAIVTLNNQPAAPLYHLARDFPKGTLCITREGEVCIVSGPSRVPARFDEDRQKGFFHRFINLSTGLMVEGIRPCARVLKAEEQPITLKNAE